MNEIWNLWDVKPPPVCTVKTELHLKGITSLNEIAFNALKTVRGLNHFDREAAILSRFLYKNRRTFRHDKGIQSLVKVKGQEENFMFLLYENVLLHRVIPAQGRPHAAVEVNQCLKRYLKLDLAGVLLAFKQSLPFKFGSTATFAYLPTKQMLKWILLRLQAFSQLFARTIKLAKEAGAYIYKKLYLGWSLHLSFMIFSMLSRILATSKYLVTKSIEWYTGFYKCLPFLQETSEFLPDYDFPSDLKLWLGEVDLTPLKKKTFIDKIFEFIDLSKEGEKMQEDSEEIQIVHEKFIQRFFRREVVDVDSDVEEVVNETPERKTLKRPAQISQHEDFGVPVDDEKCALERPVKKMKKRGKNKICKNVQL